MKVDLIIPTIEKDLPILPLSVESCRKYIQDDIDKIYVVAPTTDRIKNRCDRLGVELVNEKDYLGFGIDDMPMRKDRRGWVYQQLIKIKGLLGNNRHYIVMDSDKVLLKPHRFYNDEKDCPVFFMANHECNVKQNLWKLLNFPKIEDQSFVTDKMIFDKAVINEIHRALEIAHGGKKWENVIMDSYDDGSYFGFSEFEFYGNFYKNVLNFPCEQVHLNENVFNKIIFTLEDCEKIFPDSDNVAFHSLLMNNDKLEDM